MKKNETEGSVTTKKIFPEAVSTSKLYKKGKTFV